MPLRRCFGGWAIKPNSDVLRRKMRSDPTRAEEQAVSPAKAARLSFARAAEQTCKLALRVGSIRQSRLDLADVVEKLEEDWALYPLLHDDGSVGVIGLDPSCSIAFVEQQTLGLVASSGAEFRKLTRTDKALAVPFLDQFFRLFDDALDAAPTAYWTRGYRTEDATENRHLMVLLLDASEYRGFEVSCDVVGVERSVNIRLFLPMKDQRASVPEKPKKKADEGPQKPVPKLRSAALAANVEMDAVMCKVTMPLSELGRLKPGQTIALPQNASRQARLQDKSGQTSLPVQLGQLHGMRAVRLAQGNGDAPASGTDAQNHVPANLSATEDYASEEKGPPISAASPSLETHPDESVDELENLIAAGKA